MALGESRTDGADDLGVPLKQLRALTECLMANKLSLHLGECVSC